MRRALATIALSTWALGFEIGPGLHVALHEWLEEHHHGEDSAGAQGQEHGDHALEHHGVAALGAPTVLVLPPPEPRLAPPAPAAPRTAVFDATLDVLRSRGPPRTRSR